MTTTAATTATTPTTKTPAPKTKTPARKTPAPAKAAPAKAGAKTPAAKAPATRVAARKPVKVTVSFGTIEAEDFTAYADRKPTQTVLDYLAWLQAATGVTFTEDMIMAAYLCQTPLRQKYQALTRAAAK